MPDSSSEKNSKRFFFPATFRIKKRRDFKKMESANIKLQTRPFLLVLKPSETDTSRLGIVVTKKVHKRAVVRNAIRRKAREIFRHCHSDFKEPYDLLVIARKAAITCPFETMRRQITAALYQHGYLNKTNKDE